MAESASDWESLRVSFGLSHDNSAMDSLMRQQEQQLLGFQKPKRRHPAASLCASAFALGVFAFIAFCFVQAVPVSRLWHCGKSDLDNNSASVSKERISKRDDGYPVKPQPELCLTPECIHASSDFLNNLHPNPDSVDPCTNFDELVCGGFYQNVDIPSDESRVATLDQIEERNHNNLRRILDAVPTDTDENYVKLKDAYDACMDEKTVEGKGAAPLQKLIDTVKLGDSSEKSLTDVTLALIDIGVDQPVVFGVDADETNPDTVILSLYPPQDIGLPSPGQYNDTDIVAQYSEVVEQIFGGFSVPNPSAVVDLEKKLALAVTSSPPLSKKYLLADAQALLPQLSLGTIISTKAPEGYRAEQIVVSNSEAVKAVSGILADTPTEVLLSYLKWKVIQRYIGAIEDPIVTPWRRFSNILDGKDPDSFEERWETCIPVVDNDLGWILSELFVEKAFSEESKKFGDDIVMDIKTQFVETLNGIDWISDEVRDTAIKKVGNIVQKIGYSTESPDVRDPEDLKEWYRDLPIANNTLFENRVNARKLTQNKNWAQLGKPTDRARWVMTMPTVNAYYNPPGNEIVFPAGIMQNPVFYNPAVPQYLTYGAFGAVAGHELTHAFDNTGRNYDENGNKTDWWDDKTEKEFVDRANCFVEQYSNFTVTGPDGEVLNVRGEQTLGENIADAGGLKATFSAWKKREAENPALMLPGLDKYTKEQLLFLSFGTVWCGKSTPERLVSQVQTDEHSPSFARILGTVANSPDFRAAFNCPVKEPTCNLW
ncbi:hypothetical protein AJ79_05686 [Helicocarpus griseus UAMH5409]|uniref:Peptidase M13 N-terminal domain-containing protein n=1 Tax=Helicocarpus griseus UAMH5409 TaxID=1447875 RepID=A0A2B7XCJ6_9EURO|nr:hypothetical protein AJ79_05686 [Helicocarpus griseus UAMH5409]